jgi:Hereditary spastic paraplegia protein strumpellin
VNTGALQNLCMNEFTYECTVTSAMRGGWCPVLHMTSDTSSRSNASTSMYVVHMLRTFMGVIEIDPIQLLEDGLRCGIARRISAALVTHSQASY